MGSLSRDYNENVKLHKGKPTPTKWNEKKDMQSWTGRHAEIKSKCVRNFVCTLLIESHSQTQSAIEMHALGK